MNANTPSTLAGFKHRLLIPLLSPLTILLMFYSLRWAVIFGAAVFTGLVCSAPASFRTRGGSLGLAIGLAAFLWLCAASIVVLSLFGAIE